MHYVGSEGGQSNTRGKRRERGGDSWDPFPERVKRENAFIDFQSLLSERKPRVSLFPVTQDEHTMGTNGILLVTHGGNHFMVVESRAQNSSPILALKAQNSF